MPEEYFIDVDELFLSPRYNGFPLTSHKSMLRDERRIKLLARALHEVVRPGDVVVDAGTGTGIIAYLAHQAGAGRVIGLDSSPLVHTAQRVAATNFNGAPLEFHAVDLRRGRLPKVAADVIVCELLGDFGIDEGIVSAIRRLRDRLLKPGGTIVPRKLELYLCPVESRDLHSEITFWKKRRLGLDLSPFVDVAYNHIYRFTERPITLLAEPTCLWEIDFGSVRRIPRRIGARFRTSRPGLLHGFVGWFSVDLTESISISTDPRKRVSHWRQVYFPVGEPIRAAKDWELTFELLITGDPIDGVWRWRGHATSAQSSKSMHHQFDRTYDL